MENSGQGSDATALSFFTEAVKRQKDKDIPGALGRYQRSVALDPQLKQAYFGIGVARYVHLDYQLAMDSFFRVLSLSPGEADAYTNIGLIFQNLGLIDAAIGMQRLAVSLRPNSPATHLNLAYALLRKGAWREGFREYEWRRACVDVDASCPDRTKPVWNGEPLSGRRLLIYEEGGFGDAVNFVGLAAGIKDAGAVVAWVRPELVRLLASARFLNGVFPANAPAPPHDLRISVQSLPRALGITPDTTRPPAPYLFAEPSLATAWRARLPEADGRLKVGLAWRGSPDTGREMTPHFAALRDTTLTTLAPLFKVPDIAWFSLQVDPGDVRRPPDAAPGLLDFTPKIADFADTAALIANLDLVIAVDTAVVHVAGALGKPVWMLSRFDGCWRWLRGRADSFWYPSLRIFWQPRPLDWDTPVRAAAAALRAFR